MAAIFILAGGLFGFASAIASLILLDASLLMALAIWSSAGLVFLTLGLALAFVAQRKSPAHAGQLPTGTQTP